MSIGRLEPNWIRVNICMDLEIVGMKGMERGKTIDSFLHDYIWGAFGHQYEANTLIKRHFELLTNDDRR